MTREKASVSLFYSYSHADEHLRQQLENHLSILEKTEQISGLHDRKITAGEEWKTAIDKSINEAKVILLLVSSDFMKSDYCYGVEVRRAMERHERGEALVIPVILRPVYWKGAPFSRLQALPTDAKPITSWANQDEAFKKLGDGKKKWSETTIIREEPLLYYYSMLESSAKWARKQSAKGNEVPINAVIAVDNVVCSLRRVFRKLFQGEVRVITTSEEVIPWEELPEEVKNAMSDKKSNPQK